MYAFGASIKKCQGVACSEQLPAFPMQYGCASAEGTNQAYFDNLT